MLVQKHINRLLPRIATLAKTFVRCFYSSTLYRQVVTSWKGWGIGYLIMAMMVWSVPDMVRQYGATTVFTETYARNFLSQIPVMELHNGKLMIKGAMPHYVKDPSNGVTLVIIDTTGKVTSLEDDTAKVLLTDTQTIYRWGSNNIKHAAHGHSTLLISREMLENLLAGFEKWFSPVYAVAAVGAKSILFGLLAMTGALVGATYARLAGAALDLLSMARIASVAVTPSIIIYCLLELGLIHIPSWWLWAVVISCFYTLFGIRATIMQAQK